MRPDGSAIDVILENYSYSDQSPGNPYPQRTTPTLTVEQVIALLLSSGVTVTP